MSNVLQLRNDELEKIASILKCKVQDINVMNTNNIGMTNRSVVIRVLGNKYIVRFADETSAEIIDRVQECKVHTILQEVNLDPLTTYIDEQGLKIAKFVENASVCDPKNWLEVSRCMQTLKNFHKLKLKPNLKHFDCMETSKMYRRLAKISDENEYATVRIRCEYIAKMLNDCKNEVILSHIDSAPVNFLTNVGLDPLLIDWEYAGLHDPLIDIASFAINAGYSHLKIEHLCLLYFNVDDYTEENVLRVKAYCALLGLAWYNWCVYEEIRFGKHFEEYRDMMFKYANNMSKYVLRRM